MVRSLRRFPVTVTYAGSSLTVGGVHYLARELSERTESAARVPRSWIPNHFEGLALAHGVAGSALLAAALLVLRIQGKLPD